MAGRHSRDDEKIDKILDRLARSIVTPKDKGGGQSRPKISVDIWGAAIAVGVFGPKKPNAHERRALGELATRLGGYLSPVDSETTWLAVDVGVGRPGGQPHNASLVARFVAELRQILSGVGRLGCHIDVSRGVLLQDGPYGQAYERVLETRPRLIAGVMRLSAPVAVSIQAFSQAIGIKEEDGHYKIALPIDSRSWLHRKYDEIKASYNLVVHGDFRLKAGAALSQSRNLSPEGPPEVITAFGGNRSSRRKAMGEAHILSPAETLEIKSAVAPGDWAYLILQQDSKLIAVLGDKPFQSPGHRPVEQVGLHFDDEKVVIRPLLLVAPEPIPGLSEMVEKTNGVGVRDAERVVGTLQLQLNEAGIQDFAMLLLRCFTQNFDPIKHWKSEWVSAKEALDSYEFERAAKILEGILSRPMEVSRRAEALCLYARALRVVGARQGALDYLMEARALVSAMPDKKKEAEVEREIGRTLVDMRDCERALGYLERATSIFQTLDEKDEEARSYFELGVAFRRLDRLNDGLIVYNRGLASLGQADASRLGASIRAGMGQIYHDLRHLKLAKDYFTDALSRFKALDLPRGEMQVRLNLTALELDLPDGEGAVAHAQAAVQLAETNGNEQEIALARMHLGMAFEAIDENKQALHAYEEALSALPSWAPIFRAGNHMCMARVYLGMEDFESTEAHLQVISQLPSELPMDLKWQVALLRAQWKEKTGAKSIAREYLVGVEAIEDVRAELPHLLRTQFLEHSQQLFHGWVNRLYLEGAPAAQVLNAVERVRGRAFLDAMVSSMVGQKSAEETNLLAMADWLPKSRPKAIELIQDQFPDHLTTLVFHCLDNRTLIFRVNADDVDVFSIDIKVEAIREMAQAARQYAAEPEQDHGSEPWQILSDLLIKPILDWLPEDDSDDPVAMVLHGPLYGVPFHALPHPKTGAPMVMHHRLFYLPSLQALERWLGGVEFHGESALVFVDSQKDLPHALDEGQWVQDEIEGSQLFEQEAASIEAYEKHAGSSRYIHFALHGRRARAGEPAALLMAKKDGDGYDLLTAEAIAKKPLRGTELTVLSACESGSGELSPAGEGPDLLSWAFLMAGSQSVISTGWPVHDRLTKELMAEFYRGLAAGKSKLVALSDAQRSFIQRDALSYEPVFDVAEGQQVSATRQMMGLRMGPPKVSTSNPHYWAAFSLLGDWR